MHVHITTNGGTRYATTFSSRESFIQFVEPRKGHDNGVAFAWELISDEKGKPSHWKSVVDEGEILPQ